MIELSVVLSICVISFACVGRMLEIKNEIKDGDIEFLEKKLYSLEQSYYNVKQNI